MKVINIKTQQVLSDNLAIADSPLKRLVGLLGKSHLPVGKGLLITPCKGIHTIGMRFPIDVLFLNRELTVIAIKKNLSPNRISRIYLHAYCVIELPIGTIDHANTKIGDPIAFETTVLANPVQK